MAHKFALSADTKAALSAAHDALDAEMQEHRDAWDERSEAWQEGETGDAASTWIETLGELAEALDSYDDKPE